MRVLSQLNPATHLSPSLRGEIAALERERDPALAETGLLNLGRRAERDGQVEIAADLYRLLAGQAQPSTAEQARQRLGAMTGHEPGALRWEFLANRFREHLIDLPSLVGMGVAGLAFRGIRLWTLSRLAQSATPSLPIGASLFATAMGLSAETAGFLVGSAATEMALGRRTEYPMRDYARDFASTYILFGSMRAWGGAVPLLLRSRLGTSPLSLPWRNQLGLGLTQHLAMFGGIMSTRLIESRIGLREPDESAAMTASESLATLIHFNLAGRFAHAVYGPRWAAYERDLDRRSADLGNPRLRARHVDGEWIRPNSLPRPDRLGSIPTWSRHLRSILLSPMWWAMGAGGAGGGFGGPRSAPPAGERGREFRRLLDMGFGPNSMPPLNRSDQIVMAPRILEYFNAGAEVHPQAHDVANYFLRHLQRQPPELRRDVAIEIARSGQGLDSLIFLYSSLRDTGHLLEVSWAWHQITGSPAPSRRAEAVRQQLHLGLIAEQGEARRFAVQSLAGRLRDPETEVRSLALANLGHLERIFESTETRRDFLRGFQVLLNETTAALQDNRLSSEQIEVLHRLPVSVRYRLVQRLLLITQPSHQSLELIRDSTQENRFIDFVLDAKFLHLRSVEE